MIYFIYLFTEYLTMLPVTFLLFYRNWSEDYQTINYKHRTWDDHTCLGKL